MGITLTKAGPKINEVPNTSLPNNHKTTDTDSTVMTREFNLGVAESEAQLTYTESKVILKSILTTFLK